MAWYHEALCREVGIELFFPEIGENDLGLQARDVCKLCTVRVECLEEALRLRDFNGVLGGATGDERRAMVYPGYRRKRPRKAA